MNDELLKRIEEYAGYFLSIKEIAALTDINENVFFDIESTEYKAYYKGKTLSKLEIRKNIVKLAKHGSPQAEQLVDKFISDQELTEPD